MDDPRKLTVDEVVGRVAGEPARHRLFVMVAEIDGRSADEHQEKTH